MGDEGDGAMHGTPEEAHEVSDKLLSISTFSNIKYCVLNTLKLI